MKNHGSIFINPFISLFIAAVLFGWAGCKQSETKVEAKVEPTELPVNSSPEAVAAFKKGMEFLDVGNSQQARVHFSKAIELDSNFASAYIFRSGTSPSNEHFRSDLMSATKKSNENESERILIDIYTTYLNNNTEERLKQSQQLVTSYPTSARALVVLGDAYADISDHTKSREQYQKAIELDPNWVGGYFSLGISYLNLEPKDFKKAEENFTKVVALKPDFSGSHVYLGDSYRAQNDLEKARASYQTALEKDPNDALTYLKRGHVNSYLGSYDEARSDYRKASELNPDNKIAPTNFEAFTYLYAGDFKTARSWLEEKAKSINALGLKPSQVNDARSSFLTNCAMIAFQQEDVKEVNRYIGLMKPVSIKIGEEIGSEEAKLQQQATILTWEAYAAALKGDYAAATTKAEAIKATLEPVKNANKLWGYYGAMSYISFRQGKFGEAIALQEQSDPNAPYSKYRLALAYEKGGQPDKASKLYSELVDYNFNNIGYALIRKELKDKIKSS
ncbi:MAG TPA: tetratricopeptide repeat protein [Cyclobacteriaceae bacterium]|nr:tetratricopeptide repeat protein [Cyclobacteriaceae bacterium]